AGTAATLPRHPCRPRAGGVAQRVLRRQHLRRACRAQESALRHHEKLDPAGDDQIEGLSGAMTDVDNHEESSPNELLAAEYALGVLAGTERTAAAQRVARDRAFAALVAAWEERLAPWTAELPEVAPPPQVWERIAAQLSGAQRQRPKFWQSLMFWRGFGIVSALAAACLAVVLYLNVASQQAALVASIEGDGQRIFVAVIDVKRAAITVVPAAYRPDPTRVPELWLVPPGGKPLPLGVLPSDRPTQIALPATFADQARRDAGPAVSLEPPGGSPTAQTPGPVIGSGKPTNMRVPPRIRSSRRSVAANVSPGDNHTVMRSEQTMKRISAILLAGVAPFAVIANLAGPVPSAA